MSRSKKTGSTQLHKGGKFRNSPMNAADAIARAEAAREIGEESNVPSAYQRRTEAENAAMPAVMRGEMIRWNGDKK